MAKQRHGKYSELRSRINIYRTVDLRGVGESREARRSPVFIGTIIIITCTFRDALEFELTPDERNL